MARSYRSGEDLAAVKRARIRKEKRARKKKRRVVLISELLIFALLLTTTLVMAKTGQLHTDLVGDEETADESETVRKSENYQAIAVFGVDETSAQNGETESYGQCDVIMLATIDKETKEICIENIYQDTYLQMADGTYGKAKNLYADGPEKAAEQLGKNLDVFVDDYVTISYNAMAEVVDAAGGVSMDLSWTEATMINDYMDETAEEMGCDPEYVKGNGAHDLSGLQAVTFARLKKLDGGDEARIERQRTMMGLVFESLKKMGSDDLEALVETVFPEVTTSLSMSDIISMAKDAGDYSLGEMGYFPGENETVKNESAGNVVAAAGFLENVEELHAFLFEKDSYQASETIQQIADDVAAYTGVVRQEETDTDANASVSNAESGAGDADENGEADDADENGETGE